MLSQSSKRKKPSHRSPKAQQEDEIQRRQLRWCFFIILTIWTLTSLVAPMVVFGFTKNPLSFSLFSTLAPPIYLWYRFAKHLFPMDEKTFELEKMRLEMKGQNNKHAH